MTWQHPSTAMPTATIAAVAASKQGAGFLEERKALWKESFRSLYMALQSGGCHCFYFMTPQVGTVCWVCSKEAQHVCSNACSLCTYLDDRMIPLHGHSDRCSPFSSDICVERGPCRAPQLRSPSLVTSVRVQDAHRPFVAYFGAAGTLSRPRMHAWMSRSTHGLRKRLRAEPHGLVFTAPLAPGADVSAREECMQAELKEASQVVSFPVYPGYV